MAPPRTAKGKTPVSRNTAETPPLPPATAQHIEQTPNTLDLINKRIQTLEGMISTLITAQVKDHSPTYVPTPTAVQAGPSPAVPTSPLTQQQMIPRPTNLLPPHMPIKIKGPKPFKGDERTLEKFLCQMDEYFHPYKYVGDDDKLFAMALSRMRILIIKKKKKKKKKDDDKLAALALVSVLDWWRQRKATFATWAEAKQALTIQYGDNFVQENARQDLEERDEFRPTSRKWSG